MRFSSLNRLLQCAGALALVAGITAFYLKVYSANLTTVALTFILAILAVSTIWDMAVSVVMSIAAMLTYDYFFLPPTGHFAIADPENWTSLFTFLVVAVIASHLAARARQKTADASARRREIERLYSFSRGLLQARNVMELLNRVPVQIVEAFEVGAAAIFLADKQKVYRSGPVISQLDTETLKTIMAREEPVIDAAHSVCFLPVRLGVRAVGSLGISGQILPRPTLEAIGTLVAIAMEHARAMEQVGQTEAAREAEKLRTALLDAVTHDLRTPLTSIKASVTNLLSNPDLRPDQREELLTIINEESDRLNHLVGEAAEMARLDAGELELKAQARPIDDVIKAALEHCRSSLGNRPVKVQVAEGLPLVHVDVERAREVLVQLIENANRYSPPDQPIGITAEPGGEFVITSVADRGDGIDDQEQSLIFEKFYRGRDQRYSVEGTGMGLPIAKAIVEAHGGTISLTSQRGHGSVFSFTLPVERGRPGQLQAPVRAASNP
ncbi:MAG TPA: ATP-binding protein [Candidatus Acidoferrales bacterium]|nr:ATP-binding protein [Candidatus Acidoferrales bacterium]